MLTASTVVLTDERISHVGDPHAVRTSCSYVDLVDISSNAFSDWHEVETLDALRFDDGNVFLGLSAALVVATRDHNQSEFQSFSFGLARPARRTALSESEHLAAERQPHQSRDDRRATEKDAEVSCATQKKQPFSPSPPENVSNDDIDALVASVFLTCLMTD